MSTPDKKAEITPNHSNLFISHLFLPLRECLISGSREESDLGDAVDYLTDRYPDGLPVYAARQDDVVDHFHHGGF